MVKPIKYKYFIKNLHWTIGHKDLKSYFMEFGEVHSAWVNFNKETGFSEGNGCVCFTRHLQLDEFNKVHTLRGERLEISAVEERKKEMKSPS